MLGNRISKNFEEKVVKHSTGRSDSRKNSVLYHDITLISVFALNDIQFEHIALYGLYDVIHAKYQDRHRVNNEASNLD